MKGEASASFPNNASGSDDSKICAAIDSKSAGAFGYAVFILPRIPHPGCDAVDGEENGMDQRLPLLFSRFLRPEFTDQVDLDVVDRVDEGVSEADRLLKRRVVVEDRVGLRDELQHLDGPIVFGTDLSEDPLF